MGCSSLTFQPPPMTLAPCSEHPEPCRSVGDSPGMTVRNNPPAPIRTPTKPAKTTPPQPITNHTPLHPVPGGVGSMQPAPVPRVGVGRPGQAVPHRIGTGIGRRGTGIGGPRGATTGGCQGGPRNASRDPRLRTRSLRPRPGRRHPHRHRPACPQDLVDRGPCAEWGADGALSFRMPLPCTSPHLVRTRRHRPHLVKISNPGQLTTRPPFERAIPGRNRRDAA